MLLPDVNLWLALAFEAHVHHTAAKAWFDPLSEADRCAFCRMTQQGFLRLVTNPKAFGDEAVTLPEAWRLYDAFLADPRISFAEEQPESSPSGATTRRHGLFPRRSGTTPTSLHSLAPATIG